MPELPEAQTIVSDLKKVLPGLKITGFWTDIASFGKIKDKAAGKKILGLERKGKNILIHLSDNLTLLVHQKMTGHLLYGKWQKKNNAWKSMIQGPLNDPENRFIHLLFFLSNGYQLALCDMRKFAKALTWPTDKLTRLKDIKNLGPDPFDKNFTFGRFKEIISKKSGKIKTVLMDQSLISGIGNIYSDEILWFSAVHPLKPAKKLKEKEIKKIYRTIRFILKKAIRARGSSYIDYRDAFGRKGKYQEMHCVYQMTGMKCKKKDGGIIEKIKIGGRSAHFCPVHQKL
ncbi:MAG: DNA-formamidopyrimidine glycosylase [Candidatus Tagabacteria bacterium RIFCSPLOWO2_01_FULL_42_9]|uniref:DNA-formamidopyrimidine glycosylase n=1 Tax=Candidatus Tagabacteria bacterium RIFCSPLOWO2_01_FULL_42_9 TaxID=1802296 RepID=A0A1G2LWI2_9BACT|nr:MAG: DNA-formamidopyrimidine glycosylase [Candidatus Tagabacteria bacterium RIFCSPLOWO2_01_FULL_42_9]